MRRPIEERVLELERRLYSIQHDVIGGRQAVPKFDSRPQVRIGRVANTPSASDNTFDIVFLDGSYTQTAGQQSPAYVDRQLMAKAVAFNLAGTKLNQNDKVPVYWSNGHWWLYSPEGTEPPTPSAENVAIVRVAQTTGGSTHGDLQERQAQCVWPGFKSTFDPAQSQCSLTAPYGSGESIWMVSIEGHVGVRAIELGDRYLGMKLADAFSVSGDTRELWGFRPKLEQPMEVVFVQETFSSAYSERNVQCYYDGYLARDPSNANQLRSFAAQRRTSSGANACFTLTSSTPVFVVDINTRKFVKNGYYVAYKMYESFTIGAITRPLYLLVAPPLPQAGRFITNAGTNVSSGGTITISAYASTNPSNGQLVGVSVDVAGEVTFEFAGTYLLMASAYVSSGAGSWAGIELSIETKEIGDPFFAAQITGAAPSFNLATANVGTSCTVFTVFNFNNPGGKARVRVRETTGLRSATVSAASLLIEGQFE